MGARRSVLIVLLWPTLAVAQPGPESVPPERRPYAIRAHVTLAPGVRLDERGRADLLDGWLDLARRFVGAPWSLEVEPDAGPLAGRSPEDVTAEMLEGPGAGVDRLWLIRVEPAEVGWRLSGRAFDPATAELGPVCTRPAPYPADAARALFELSLELFSPSAEVGELAGGDVVVTVQGASLAPASPAGRVVEPGSVFKVLRVFQNPDGSTLRVVEVPLTYLSVKEVTGPVARCAIVSPLADPLTRMVGRRNAVVARGVRVAAGPTRFRFVTEPDKQPAAGYVLSARTWPDGAPRDVATTDRDGRVELPAGFADGLVLLRLVAGSVEPMVEFPAMPGESGRERTIRFAPKPETVALQAQVDALRDAILDVVAVRGRLEARLKARADGEDWAGVEATLAEARGLTPRASFTERLDRLRDDAARRQAETRRPILTKTAQARIAEVQALIDRYLDDEVFQAYAEALEQAKAKQAQPKAASPKGTADG